MREWSGSAMRGMARVNSTQQGLGGKTLATGVARDCGDVGNYIQKWRFSCRLAVCQAGNGMACSRAKARLNWVMG